MRKIGALIRATALTSLSYRLETVFSLGGLMLSIVPLYFLAHALQPLMANSLRSEGQQYFGFLALGTITFVLMTTTLRTLPEAIRSGIARGTLEALLATPTPLPVLLAGLACYPLLWNLVGGGLTLGAAYALGAHVAWAHGLAALGIVLLIVLTHLPFALLSSSLVLAYKTTGPVSMVVVTLSALLGGVYYPTLVLPPWLQPVAALLPLTYGLRALRRTLLDGAPLAAVATDLAVLATFGAVLLGAGVLVFTRALGYARRAGTLAQY